MAAAPIPVTLFRNVKPQEFHCKKKTQLKNGSVAAYITANNRSSKAPRIQLQQWDAQIHDDPLVSSFGMSKHPSSSQMNRFNLDMDVVDGSELASKAAEIDAWALETATKNRAEWWPKKTPNEGEIVYKPLLQLIDGYPPRLHLKVDTDGFRKVTCFKALDDQITKTSLGTSDDLVEKNTPLLLIIDVVNFYIKPGNECGLVAQIHQAIVCQPQPEKEYVEPPCAFALGECQPASDEPKFDDEDAPALKRARHSLD